MISKSTALFEYPLRLPENVVFHPESNSYENIPNPRLRRVSLVTSPKKYSMDKRTISLPISRNLVAQPCSWNVWVWVTLPWPTTETSPKGTCDIKAITETYNKPRDFFYMNKDMFGGQPQSDKLIEETALLLAIPRDFLNIVRNGSLTVVRILTKFKARSGPRARCRGIDLFVEWPALRLPRPSHCMKPFCLKVSI